MKTTQKFINELKNCGKIPMLEYELKNGDFLTFDIFITSNGWIKARGEKSFSTRIDKCFSLDDHLQYLGEKITNYYIDNIKF